jgi:hypothetical protein
MIYLIKVIHATGQVPSLDRSFAAWGDLRPNRSREIAMSLIGSKAPDWSGVAFHRGERRTLGSTDYAGKWHIIYRYPLDFTWICPTEIRQ